MLKEIKRLRNLNTADTKPDDPSITTAIDSLNDDLAQVKQHVAKIIGLCARFLQSQVALNIQDHKDRESISLIGAKTLNQ